MPNIKVSSVTVIEPFNYQGVQLLPSMFQEQFEHTKQYFLSIPNEDLLKPFRKKAGMDAPGKDLGGWYKYPATFGQWLGAFARMYRVTGDKKILRKLKYLLKEWGKTIDAGSYLLSCTHYGFDKIVGGLVDIYEYTEEELLRKEALKYLHKVTDWAIKNLSRRRLPATRILPNGGGPVNGGVDVEWYTLSENLYRAYILTGDLKFREFAEVWHYDTYWDGLARNKHVMTGLHAYSHVNTLCSAAMAFAVTANPKYLKTIVNAYDMLQNTQVFATGGYGPTELLVSDQYGALGESLYALMEIRKSFETPCGTWAAFKLARYLMMFTGEARYGDWIEKLLYNAIGAALLMGEGGKTYYYSDYSIRGAKKSYLEYPPEGAARWPCCSGTYPLAVTEYHNLIYFKDADSLYVNLYVPSQVEWDKSGSHITVIQETEFPEKNKVFLRIHTPEPVDFSLKFRVPGWVYEKVKVYLNGEPVSGVWKPGFWGEIRRTWNNGDFLEIDFPLNLYFLPVDKYHPNIVALMYGPVVLVADKGGVLKGPIDSPSDWIIRVSDEALIFRTRGQQVDKEFRPYYSYKEGEKYFMYQEVEDQPI